MSAALYFYFWTAWSGGAPSPTPAPTPAPDAFFVKGGKNPNQPANNRKKSVPYVQLDPQYWDIREAYLRQHAPPEPPPPAPPPRDLSGPAEANRLFEARAQQLEQLNAERAETISALRHSTSLEAMRKEGEHLDEINTKIAELMGKQAYARFIQS